MFSPIFARWSILVGLSASVFGIILYFQLGRIVDLHVGFDVLSAAAVLSLCITPLGLLAAVIGGLTWACRAQLAYLLLAAAAVGIVAFLLAEFVNINIHGPTAIFIFVIFAGALFCVLILLIASVRFIRAQRQHRSGLS
jgi:hypothetical protein